MQNEDDFSYHDDPIQEHRDVRHGLRKFVSVILLCVLGLFGTTFAGNINLSAGESSEFGQGFVRSIACDSRVTVKLSSKYQVNFRGSTDGFSPEVSVEDVANSCVGTRLIINLYGETSNIPLNLYPVIIDFTPRSGGMFTGLSSLTSSYFPFQEIDSSTNGSGSLGGSSEFGKSSFTAQPFWGVDGEEPEAREVRLVTIESTRIPEDSPASKFANFNVNVTSTYQGRSILIKVPMNLNLVDASQTPSNISHEIGANSNLNGFTFESQPIVVALPIDTNQSVTESSYTFSGSGITCVFITREVLVARYRCSTSTSNWSLGITS